MDKVIGYDYRYKILIIGEGGAGKTSLVNRMMSKDGDVKEVDTTIGVEFTSTVQTVENKMIKIHMWDCAGSEAFFPLIQVYFRDTACAIIVMDLTSDIGLMTTEKWIKRYLREKGKTEIPFILIGNKLDLICDRKISKEKADELAKKYGVKYIEVSAKTGANTINCLNMITKHIYDNMDKGTCGIMKGYRCEIEPHSVDDYKDYKCCVIN